MKYILITIAGLAIIAIGYLATNSPTQPTPSATSDVTTQERPVTTPLTDVSNSVAATSDTDNAETVAAEPTIDEATTADMVATDTTAPGIYTEYTANAVADSTAERIFLFFHATWCPSCRALEADITANLNDIPPGVAIYKVDYDTATELKQTYGITRQHSVIEVTQAGTITGTVTHPPTLTSLLTS